MFGLIRSQDIASVDTDETLMLAVQFPAEWLTMPGPQLVDAIGNNAERFLTAVYQAVMHYREHPEPRSALELPASATHQLRKVKDVGEL